MLQVLLLTAIASTGIGLEPCEVLPETGVTALEAEFGTVLASTRADAQAGIDAGETALAAAKRYLAFDPPRWAIVDRSLSPELLPEACGPVFDWRFGPELPAHVLPHEIGHDVFIRYLVPRSRVDEYGGGAPDWLDEMAAMAFEPAEGVAMRRGEAQRFARRGALVPLSRLLSMKHPEWSARRADGTVQGPAGQPLSAETPAFYATVRALFDFLVDRSGRDDVVAELARAYRAGQPLNRWILAASSRKDLTDIDAELAGFAIDEDYVVAGP